MLGCTWSQRASLSPWKVCVWSARLMPPATVTAVGTILLGQSWLALFLCSCSADTYAAIAVKACVSQLASSACTGESMCYIHGSKL